MKALVRQIAALAGILLLIVIGNRLISGNAYTAYLPPAENVRFTPADGNGMQINAATPYGDHMRVNIVPHTRGRSVYRVSENGREERREFRVSPFMTVYDVSTGGFTGDTVVLLALTAFFLLTAAIMTRYALSVRPPRFYAYTTIYAAGFSLFMLLTGATLAYVAARHIAHPAAFSMLMAYEVVSRAGYSFMMATSPFMVVFAVSMTVSNIALMRHERARLRNALGMAAGLIMLLGMGLAMWMDHMGMDHPGSDEDMKQVALFVFPTIFVYFECMLIGAIICGIRAARHVPAYDRDCLIILGCWFRKDGTLTPLLKGRVDKAIEFWRKQKERTGREAVFIPSGGQGADEPMPEAEAMARYLRTQGVPEGAIHIEDQSRNTYQNMAFSKEIIRQHFPGARPAYVTTNYHVFRSGVWANLAGLPAEGLGSDTRWWYWPNAFMRECVGLLVNRWRQEILLLLILILFFGTLASLL